MNNEMIEWLKNYNNNNNNNNSSSSNTTLIECILILSINGVLIDIQSLIDYCNNVINNIDKDKGNEKNDDKVINNNNKRIKNNITNEDNEIKSRSPSSLNYGLSKQQFQTVYNHINNINGSNNSSTITLNNNNDNNNNDNSDNDDTEECISNKIKFTNSISIINENNKRILKQQQQQQQNTFNNNNNIINNNKKKIKSCNCNNNNNNIISNNNNNNGSSGIRDIDIVFFKVWRNLIIRNEILFHTRLYNIHYNTDGFRSFTFDEFSKYKYKSYLHYLEIVGEDEENEYEEKEMVIFKPNVLPSSLSEIHISDNINVTFEVNSIPDSVTSATLHCYGTSQIFSKGVFPDSITYLDFEYTGNQKLSLEWLPSSLKTLKLTSSFQQSIEPNQLPESLTELRLHKGYEGVIVPGSIPLAAVKSLNYIFEPNGILKELNEYSIPKSTTHLEFYNLFDQTIKPGDIPHNVTSIDFSANFNSEIQVGSLPLSLKTLKLGYFDRIINSNVLPSNLTSIDMGYFNQPLIPNLFPQSITSIKFGNFNQPIPEGYFYNYTNLKSMEFTFNFNQVIPVNTLPSSLTTLGLGWNYNIPLNTNSLPTSLSKLILMSPSYQLIANEQLPSSITSLSYSSNHSIPIGLLPCNLNEFYILNNDFNQDITVDGFLPLHSLQSIYINSSNLNFINSLDSHFFNKYINFSK